MRSSSNNKENRQLTTTASMGATSWWAANKDVCINSMYVCMHACMYVAPWGEVPQVTVGWISAASTTTLYKRYDREKQLWNWVYCINVCILVCIYALMRYVCMYVRYICIHMYVCVCLCTYDLTSGRIQIQFNKIWNRTSLSYWASASLDSVRQYSTAELKYCSGGLIGRPRRYLYVISSGAT